MQVISGCDESFPHPGPGLGPGPGIFSSAVSLSTGTVFDPRSEALVCRLQRSRISYCRVGSSAVLSWCSPHVNSLSLFLTSDHFDGEHVSPCTR